jgi:predicted hydrocarbon binding protein
MVRPEEAVIVNALVRQALIAAEEVMGEHGLHAVLRASGLERFIGNLPPDDLEPGIPARQYALFNQAIEDFYGRGGRGILKRIGQASFRYGLREQSALMGLAGLALKALPKHQRVRFVLNSMADALKKTNPQVEAWVGEEDGVLYYAERTCAICNGRTSDHPICYLYVGSLTEAVQWATGMRYNIRETKCKAMGDEYCLFEIREPST